MISPKPDFLGTDDLWVEVQVLVELARKSNCRARETGFGNISEAEATA